MNIIDKWVVTVLIVGAVVVAVAEVARAINRQADRAAWRRENHAHPQEWD